MARTYTLEEKLLKRNMIIPIWLVIIILALLALGWLVAFYLLGAGEIKGDIFRKIAGPFIEVFKALFYGITISFFINTLLMKYVLGESLATFLKTRGIKYIYHTRTDSTEDLLESVKKTKNIYISGISLREFLTGAGHLRKVWFQLFKRLAEEEQKKISDEKRLQVHLLILDPRSSEGLFRQKVQARTLGLDLFGDILVGLNEIFQAKRKIYSDTAKHFLHARLYEHCPFTFIFATDNDIFVEPYYYRTYEVLVSDIEFLPGLPLIRYGSDTEQYKQLLDSVKTIWKYAHEEVWKYSYKEDSLVSLSETAAGIGYAAIMQTHPETAAGIEFAAIRHIFRKNQREFLSNRELECLQEIIDRFDTDKDKIDWQEVDPINVLATSAKFYFLNSNVRRSLLTIAKKITQFNYERCDFRLVDEPNLSLENEIHQSKMDLDSKKNKYYAVLIVGAASASENWTLVGFDNKGELRKVLINDPNDELSKELKKEPCNRNERRILELATSSLGLGLHIKIAIANSVSQQSILRAIADSKYPDQIKDELNNWDWDRHSNSPLYLGIKGTIETIKRLKKQGHPFDLKLYSSSISCAMLLTPYSTFIEQYFYGRSNNWEPGHVLGGEYPVFELGLFEHKEFEEKNETTEEKNSMNKKENKTTEWQVLKSHFDTIWKSYSVSIDEYEKTDAREEFNKNRCRLLEELRLNGSSEAVVAAVASGQSSP